ncbi:MAG TPA: hypothetical protein VMG10_12720 [Gemmataceae bacterium]|nr:hypothetical protein [Gemmataceae bacterium]
MRKHEAPPAKPYPWFPLRPYPDGPDSWQWAKQLEGGLYFFGPVEDVEGALRRYETWLQERKKPRRRKSAAVEGDAGPSAAESAAAARQQLLETVLGYAYRRRDGGDGKQAA